ncbi:flagellar hook-basal body complex protein FliE [Pontibacillus salicampi]|uniref:Flagellar hook-basal body complex protein FliE n=1 Tax=Pontibacillus salicampi TaxID=1449801 RepID=A0ABV6LP74_9BACI
MNMNTIGDAFSHIQAASQNTISAKPKTTPAEAQANFAESLTNAINEVNEAKEQSNIKTEQLAKGEIDNLHDVMITAQKASITLQTAVQIQGKVVDAYKEISRMQV